METAVVEVDQKRNRKGVVKNGKTVNYGGNGGGESERDHAHILTERQRRKNMRNMFASLHSLLPQLPPKADKSTIVDEAVKHIKTLQEALQTLETQRQEKLQGATIVDSEPSSVISPQTEALESREAFLAIQGPSKSFSMPPCFPLSFSSLLSDMVFPKCCDEYVWK